MMDRISLLPDETLTKIFSFLQTKDVMRTMLLSKRFKSLWIFVQRLEFDATTHSPEPEYSYSHYSQYSYSHYPQPLDPGYAKFRVFVDRSLMSREGHVLQSLSLKLSRHCTDDDTAIWVSTAVKRGLMELKLEYRSSCGFLPKSLYTCETLVVLKLVNANLDVPDLVSFKSLRTLSLKSMNSSNPSSLLRLLPNCPVLEDLFIQQCPYHQQVLNFKIAVPSLKRLSLLDSSKDSGIKGLVLDVPCLEYLHIVDRSGGLSFSETVNISEVVKANIEVVLHHPEKLLLHSLASVEDIRFCLSASEVVYPVGIVFHRLKHLEVCTCKAGWLDLFMHLLKDSPSLKVIKIDQCHPVTNPPPHWNQPSSVPKCLSSNLETLEWIKYEGTHEEKQLSTYIFKTAVCLKKASFTAKSTDSNKKLQMLQELSLSRRASSACELVFN